MLPRRSHSETEIVDRAGCWSNYGRRAVEDRKRHYTITVQIVKLKKTGCSIGESTRINWGNPPYGRMISSVKTRYRSHPAASIVRSNQKAGCDSVTPKKKLPSRACQAKRENFSATTVSTNAVCGRSPKKQTACRRLDGSRVTFVLQHRRRVEENRQSPGSSYSRCGAGCSGLSGCCCCFSRSFSLTSRRCSTPSRAQIRG